MSRLHNMFDNFKKKREKAFIPFFVVGDPNPEDFLKIISEIEPIVDIIELGIPFSDPIADGPVIQEANKRAFYSGMNYNKALKLIAKIRQKSEKPIVILTYANVIGVGQRMNQTIKDLSEVGVDGIIAADIPIEEASPILNAVEPYEMDIIFLITPNTTVNRLSKILDIASGFLYLVAVRGVTGTRDAVLKETTETIESITSIIGEDRDIPICVGFGISKPKHVKKIVGLGADGVIVGSAIIRLIRENLDNTELMIKSIKNFILEMRKATRSK
ncbi:MAG: tryptophan synthase subunit alpha [Candidatus Lokiarchaeota archaeon]|nr:tryptophan synthase subunit alpha [Candidatus Lokiarchaeota archaeon]